MKRIFVALLTILALQCGTAFAKTGEGMTIWFDTGGSAGDGYGTILQNGAKAAAEDMGCDLRLMYSDWNPELMLTNFRNALAARPDGIVVIGSPGEPSFAPLIDKAIAQGTIVTCIDTALKESLARHQAEGFGFVGTDNYAQGKALTDELLRRTNLQKGDRAFVWGLKRLPERGRRALAIVETLEAAGVIVDYQEISPEIDKDPVLGGPVVAGQVASHPDTKVIIVDHGSLTAQMGNHLKNAGVPAGQIYTAGFSLSPATAKAIEDGYVQLISEAQPYIMGYFGVVQAVLSKKFGFTGFNIDTGGGIIDASNIASVSALAKQGLR
ncbi:MAG: substrate-binding domain-containing protein [Pseudomonadota bacterium]